MLPAVANLLRSPLRLARRSSSIFESPGKTPWSDGHARRKTGMSDVYTAEADEESKENVVLQTGAQSGFAAACGVHQLPKDDPDNVDMQSAIIIPKPAPSESTAATLGSVTSLSRMPMADAPPPVFAPAPSPAREHSHIETSSILTPDEILASSMMELAMAQVTPHPIISPTLIEEKTEVNYTVVNGLIFEPFGESFSDDNIGFFASNATIESRLPNPFSVHEQLIFAENSKLEEELREHGHKPVVPLPRVLPPEIRVFSWMDNYWSSLDREETTRLQGTSGQKQKSTRDDNLLEDNTIFQATTLPNNFPGASVPAATFVPDDGGQPTIASPVNPLKEAWRAILSNSRSFDVSASEENTLPSQEHLEYPAGSSDDAMMEFPEVTGTPATDVVGAQLKVAPTTDDLQAAVELVSEDNLEILQGEASTSVTSSEPPRRANIEDWQRPFEEATYEVHEPSAVCSPAPSSDAEGSCHERSELVSSGTTPLLVEEFSTPLSTVSDAFTDAFDASSSTSSPVFGRERFETATSLSPDSHAPPSTSTETITEPVSVIIAIEPANQTTSQISDEPTSARSLDFSLATDLCVTLLREALDAVKSAEEHLDAMLVDHDPAVPAAPSSTPADRSELLEDAGGIGSTDSMSQEIISALASVEFTDRHLRSNVSADPGSVTADEEDVIVLDLPRMQRGALELLPCVVPLPGSPDIPACEVALPETPELASSSQDQLAYGTVFTEAPAAPDNEELQNSAVAFEAAERKRAASLEETDNALAVRHEAIASQLHEGSLPTQKVEVVVAASSLSNSPQTNKDFAKSSDAVQTIGSSGAVPVHVSAEEAMKSSGSEANTLSMEISVGSAEVQMASQLAGTEAAGYIAMSDLAQADAAYGVACSPIPVPSDCNQRKGRAEDLPLVTIPSLTITLTEPTPIDSDRADSPIIYETAGGHISAGGSENSNGAVFTGGFLTSTLESRGSSTSDYAPVEVQHPEIYRGSQSPSVSAGKTSSLPDGPPLLPSPFIESLTKSVASDSFAEVALASEICAPPPSINGTSVQAYEREPRTPRTLPAPMSQDVSPIAAFKPTTYADATNLALQFPELSQEILKLPIASQSKDGECPPVSCLQAVASSHSKPPAIQPATACCADKGKKIASRATGPMFAAERPNLTKSSKTDASRPTSTADVGKTARRVRHPTQCIAQSTPPRARERGRKEASPSTGNTPRGNETHTRSSSRHHVQTQSQVPSRRRNPTSSAEDALRSMRPKSSPVQRPRNPTLMMSQHAQSVPSLQRTVTLDDLTRSGPATAAELRKDEQRLHGDLPRADGPPHPDSATSSCSSPFSPVSRSTVPDPPTAARLPRSRTMTTGPEVKAQQQRMIFHHLGLSRAERTRASSRDHVMESRSRTESREPRPVPEACMRTQSCERSTTQDHILGSTPASVPASKLRLDDKGVLHRDWHWDRIPSAGQDSIPAAESSRTPFPKPDVPSSRAQTPGSSQPPHGWFHPYRRPMSHAATGSEVQTTFHDLLALDAQGHSAAFFVDTTGNVYRRSRRITLEGSGFAPWVPGSSHSGPPAA